MSHVLALGEVMVELNLGGGGQAAIGYAGDTFNTCIYLRRLGLEAAYATALGADDPFTRGVLDLMAGEAVRTDLVVRVRGRLPGLYAIRRDPDGERSFFYWRTEAPVREFFALADLEALTAAVRAADLLYLSGVTLAVIGEGGRAALQALARETGVALALDLNYRAALWPPVEAAAAVDALAARCRFVSASEEDLAALDLADGPARWAAAGAEVVERQADRRCVIRRPREPVVSLAPDPPVRALDTTGAGDSFNAAYLAARLAGETPEAAIRAGRRLAAVVVQHPGGIIARSAMPTRGPAGHA